MLDRKGKQRRWLRARLAEKSYNSQLLKVARAIRNIIEGMNPDGTLSSVTPLVKALTMYSEVIEPWAQSVARYMLTDVNRRNEKAWREHSSDMGKELRRTLTSTPIGVEFRSLLQENVKLITSLPLKAAEKAHSIVQEGMITSARSSNLAVDIQKLGPITANRAKLIARTEVSRAAVTLTQVRAQALGSQGYIWRTVGDGDVRPEHKEMEGKYVRWDDPPSFAQEPTLGPYHAGCGPNCRCWPEPVLPEF